jgi:outer membrane biosynthesis protein TonB
VKLISGGVVNGKAKFLPRPEYPQYVLQKGFRTELISGVIPVRVHIDKKGKVISAEATCGYQPLRKAAEKAALKARFNPTTLSGDPVEVTGIIIYNFKGN